MTILILSLIFLAFSVKDASAAQKHCWAQGKCPGMSDFDLEYAYYPNDCLSVCENTPGCETFSLHNWNRDCYMFREGNCQEFVEDRNFVSGHRDCEKEVGHIMVVGGANPGPSRTTELHSPTPNSLQLAPPSPYPVFAAGTMGSEIRILSDETGERGYTVPLTCGGERNGVFYDNCYILDQDNVWTTLGHLPSERAYASMSPYLGHFDFEISLSGGLGYGDKLLDSVVTLELEFSDIDNSLNLRIDGEYTLPEPMYGHCHVELQDADYQYVTLVIGGTTMNSEATATVYMSSEYFYTYETLVPMESSRTFHSCIQLEDGKVLIAGGRDASGQALDSVEIYDFVEKTTIPGPSLPTPVFGGRFIYYFERCEPENNFQNYDDARYFLMGGNNGTHLLDTVFEFDRETQTWRETEIKMDEAREHFAAFPIRSSSLP